MSTTQKITKNTIVLLIAQIITYAIGFFITMYTARYLGAAGFGILSLALSITAITIIFADLGLGSLTIRELSRDKSLTDKYFSNTLLMKVFSSFLTIGITIIIVYLFNYPQPVSTVIYIITLSMIIIVFNGIINSILQAYERMEYISINSILNSALMLVGTLIGIYYQFDVLFFASIYVISNVLTLVSTLLIYVRKFHLPRIEVDLSFWKPTLKEALPFGIAGVFVMVYYSIDSLMLSVMSGNEAVGLYSAAYKLIFLFLSFYSVYIIAIFPVMSRFNNTSNESLKFAFERSFKYLLIISIPLAIGTTLLAKKIILLIYGADYISSILALQVLIWTIIFMFLNGLSTNLLGSVNRQLVVTKITGLGAGLNILLNLILIPKFSLIGASAATVITEFSIMPLLVYIIVKNGSISFSPLIKDLPKIIISSGIMTLVLLSLETMNLFLLIIIASIVYFGAIKFTRTFDETDMKLLKSIIKKRNL
jgi:O-antigen/teichoic acid export membrane protein